MTLIAVVAMLLLSVILLLITLVQTFYLESLRLRTRDVAAQQVFKEAIDPRLGFKADAGALTFSVVKHTLLPLVGIVFLAMRTFGQPLTAQAFLEALGLSFITMVLTTYVAPQLLYRRTSCAWLVPLTPLIKGIALVVRPLIALMALLQSLADLGEPAANATEQSTPEENIDALITAGAEEGIIEEEDRKLIQSAAAFGSKTVREVMTARPAVVAISVEATLSDLRQLVINEQFSRIPVYESNIDNIVGFVHVRDMFEADESERTRRKVRELVRPISFVPETKPVDDLLREMQQEGNHMAIVVDEYGNTAGLATMEDMVEEIVGEIRDEHEPAMDVQQDAQGGYIVSGSFDVDRLQDLIRYRADTSTESTTVGGLVTEWAGHVPKVGETIERGGVRVEVLAGSELRVEQVRVSRVEQAQNGG